MTYLEFCSKKYYEGEPIISDAQYDALEASTGVSEGVGYLVSGTSVPHYKQMYSLQKIYAGDALPLPENATIVSSPKLDGAAISLLYVNGSLTMALTRGDGVKGNTITDKVLSWDEVPNNIKNTGTVQITGEVVLPRKISNARNKASGALGLKDTEEFLSRKCTFIAYGISGLNTDSYTKDMQILRSKGFKTAVGADWEEFPQDGTVSRVDSNKLFNSLGHTSKHPRGAYALKERSSGVETVLLSVTWQVGKSGKVTPVANLDPVDIDGARVTKATLNNIGFIDELGLELGDTVLVERAGGIIPRIMRKA